jgi:ABC-type nitrate/sulfonate/bicarbonate transport system substrate-binding protein
VRRPAPRRHSWRGLVAGVALVGLAAGPVGAGDELRLGLAGHAPGLLPVYVATDGIFDTEGLRVTVVGFAGEAALGQALASGAVDVAAASLGLAVTLIGAGQPARVFYGGVARAEYEWLARPEIGGWAALQGRTLGITAPGGPTDLLTRYVLARHGLTPGRAVALVPTGGSAARLEALRVGRVDATILPAPFRWQAEQEGFVRLGSQATEIGPEWPFIVFTSRTPWLDTAGPTVQRFLRAYVRGARQARADRERAVASLVRWLRFARPHAERAWDEVVPVLDERGPVRGLAAFWAVEIAAGEVTEPWSEARYVDRRFLDSFETWAPPGTR